MKPSGAFCLTIWFAWMVALLSSDVRPVKDNQLTSEKRDVVPAALLEEYLQNHDPVVGKAMDLAPTGSPPIDYSKPAGQVALEVIDAALPIIKLALTLIPGVGPDVRGLFVGVWNVISPMFAPKEINPIKNMMDELAKNLEIKMDEKLNSIINRAITGEIKRNNYICTKYNFVFQLYSKQLNSNVTLATQDALKLSMFLQDCDNFLKDTAEAFVYDEYAHMLWIPSAMTTAVRISFLTEVIKYSSLIGIDRTVTAMYFREIQNDIKRQFKLHFTGLNKLRKDLDDKNVMYRPNTDHLTGISKVEEAACQMQSHLLYFDRELYPYGMPNVVNSTELFAAFKMADYYDPKKDGSVKHLQMFFDVYRYDFPGVLPASNKIWYYTLKIMNCLMGPLYPRFPSVFWFKFYPFPSNKHSYEFRVIYFHTREYYYNPTYPVPVLIAEKRNESKEYKEFEETHRKLKMGNPGKDDINLQIKFVLPTEPLANGSKKLLDMRVVERWESCPYAHSTGSEAIICRSGIKFYDGLFRMYSAGTYNVEQYKKINRLFRVGNPSLPFQGLDHELEYGFLLGVEIILRPHIK